MPKWTLPVSRRRRTSVEPEAFRFVGWPRSLPDLHPLGAGRPLLAGRTLHEHEVACTAPPRHLFPIRHDAREVVEQRALGLSQVAARYAIVSLRQCALRLHDHAAIGSAEVG